MLRRKTVRGRTANSATSTWGGTSVATGTPAAAPATAAASAPKAAAARAQAVAQMDPALHDIYSKETSSHLAEIREYLRKRAGQPAPHVLPEPVYRAIHTLSGSTKMAEARHGTRITEPLLHVMRKVFDSGHGLSDKGLATLDDSVRAIDDVVSHINESTGFFADQPALLTRLQRLEQEVDAEIARAANDTSASAIAPGPAAIEQSAPPAEEFDSEIANIYSEEATELLEAAQASLTGWNRVRDDKQTVAELQRRLHTLKGGARMAGITAMGDLSHELETLVIQIDNGTVAGDDRAHAVMQASLDELARMRDAVSNGALPSAARELTAQLRALARQPGAGASDAAHAPLAPAPAPASATPAWAAAPAPAASPGPARYRPRPQPWHRPRRLACGRPLPGRLPRRRPQTRLSQAKIACPTSRRAARRYCRGERRRRWNAWRWREWMRICSTPCSTTPAR